MGTVFNRGTKDKPNWYTRWIDDDAIVRKLIADHGDPLCDRRRARLRGVIAKTASICTVTERQFCR